LTSRSRFCLKLPAVAAALLMTAHALLAAFRVSPGVVEGKFENGRTSGSFTVTNSDAKGVRMRVLPVHFRLSLDGMLALTPVDSTSLAPWMKITPREFTLEPNSERQVRFAIIAPDSVPDGSYWGGLEFMPLPTRQDSIDAQTSVKALAVVVVPIMVDKGRPTYSWNLDPDSMRSVATPNGVVLLAKINNQGTGRIPQKGRYEIRDASGKVVTTGETDRLSVLPHSDRFLKTAAPRDLPPGKYDYLVTYTSEVDGSKLTGAMRFDVPDKLPVAPEKIR
jgi:hypothetical protein